MATQKKQIKPIYGILLIGFQFRDQDDNLITVTEDNWQTMPLKNGDKVIMYYNPKDPKKATPESRWKEIMKK